LIAGVVGFMAYAVLSIVGVDLTHALNGLLPLNDTLSGFSK
jgi:hypothetical protein